MGAIGAGEPHRRLRSRYVDAPRQVIGFDLSATAGKPRLALDSVDENVFEANVNPAERFNCSRPYANSSKIATPKSNNTTTPSSRSALQQLLLPTPNVADPTDAFSEDNAINLSHKPSFIQPALFQAPAAKQLATAAVSKFTSNACNAFGRGIPVPFTTLNWPASKGFAQLVTRPLVHDRHSDPSSKSAVSELKSAVKVGYRSSQNPEETAHDGSGMSERYLNAKQSLNAKDWLHTERTKSTWTQKAEIEIEHPSGIRCRAELQKDSVGKDRKQARMHTSDKTKKSSLFMITGTSPIAEYGYHGFYGHGADQHNSEGMDMEFLNSCHLCKRKLGQGHDIFMYSGDKAFCSMECRHQQIEMDERKGRHTLPIIRTGTSPAYQSCMGINNSNAVICQTSAANPTAHHHPMSISRPRFMNSAAAA